RPLPGDDPRRHAVRRARRRGDDVGARPDRAAGDAMALKLLSVAGLAAFFGLWTLIAISGLVQPQFLPTPLAVAEEFWRLLQTPFAGYTLEQHLLSSLGRFGLGFALAALI